MRSITCAGVDVASKGKLMSTSRRFPASVARRMSSTLRSLKPSRPSFLQKRCTLATETLVRAANSLMESPRMSSPMARAEMLSCCSVGVRPCASVILRLISIRTPTLGKPAKKGQVYFGTFRSVSGSVRGGAAAVCGREKKCRVWRARFCPSRAQAILSLSTRDAKEILIPRALPGRACDSSPHLSNLIIWHYNHHRHAHNVALNQEEKTYGSV